MIAPNDKDKHKDSDDEDPKLIQTTSWNKPGDATKSTHELEIERRREAEAAEERKKESNKSTKKDK